MGDKAFSLGDVALAADQEITRLRAEIARLTVELDTIGAQHAYDCAALIADHRHEVDRLTEELEACAAGPWRPIAEAPKNKMILGSDGNTVGTMRWNHNVHAWMYGDGWKGATGKPATHFAEIRECPK